MDNHINFQYDYSTEKKTAEITMKIGPDEYYNKISLSYHDEIRINQIINCLDKIKNLFETHKFIVKNFFFLFENSNYNLKYKFSNYNNELHISIFNQEIWIYGFDLFSKVPKNSNTVEVDNLSALMFNSKI